MTSKKVSLCNGGSCVLITIWKRGEWKERIETIQKEIKFKLLQKHFTSQCF